MFRDGTGQPNNHSPSILRTLGLQYIRKHQWVPEVVVGIYVCIIYLKVNVCGCRDEVWWMEGQVGVEYGWWTCLVGFYACAIPTSPDLLWNVTCVCPFFYAVLCKQYELHSATRAPAAYYIIPRGVAYAKCTNGVRVVVRLPPPNPTSGVRRVKEKPVHCSGQNAVSCRNYRRSFKC